MVGVYASQRAEYCIRKEHYLCTAGPPVGVVDRAWPTACSRPVCWEISRNVLGCVEELV